MAELVTATTSTCCSPAAQEECCEPGDKDACCGTAAVGGACGCAAGDAAAARAVGDDTPRARGAASCALDDQALAEQFDRFGELGGHALWARRLPTELTVVLEADLDDGLLRQTRRAHQA